jgi:hypothetical protein
MTTYHHPKTRGERRDRAAELVSRALDRVERRAAGSNRRSVSQAFALAANLRAIARDNGTVWMVAR